MWDTFPWSPSSHPGPELGLARYGAWAKIAPMEFSSVLPFALALLASACSCQGGNAAPPQEKAETLLSIDADRAWSHMEAQVALGPRPSGSEANVRLRDFIVAELKGMGLEATRESFTAKGTPRGDVAMENIYADLEAAPRKGAPAPMILIGAHFDTKHMDFPFVGANDGASEVAVLLELARVLVTGPERDVTYRFLFLDGEEAMRLDWEDPDNRYGSRHHVSGLTKKPGALKRAKVFILLDLIGDANLQLERDSYSKYQLIQIFERAAKRIGKPNLFSRVSTPIKDDHQSFMEYGIASIDLIDMHYGEYGNEYWHTAEDTLDKCSKESLATIGRLVLAALPEVERTYGK